MFDGDASSNNSSRYTMTKFIFELLDDKMIYWGGTKHNISIDMESVECMKGICAFVKNATVV